MIDQFLDTFPALDVRIEGLNVYGTIIFVLMIMLTVVIVDKVKPWEKR